MTLATRCPACGTAFRVVSDQLRVSSGWVRCGRCGASFDALEHLFRHASTRQAPAPASPPETASMAASLSDSDAPTPESVPLHDADVQPAPAITALQEALSEAPSDAAAPPDEPLPLDVPVEPSPVTEEMPAAEPEQLNLPPAHQPEATTAEAEVEEPQPEPAPPAAEPATLATETPGWVRQPDFQPRARPSFLRRAEAAARWSHPATRMTLGLLAIVLTTVLAAQGALLWRDEIALRWPVMRPALEAACAAAQCRIEAPRRLQWLDVPSSELLSEPDGATYRLEVAIRNRGSIEALAPAIELTLTDSAGQLLARRVLTLAELGHPARAIEPGQELLVRAELVTGSAAAAGYNIALFYP